MNLTRKLTLIFVTMLSFGCSTIGPRPAFVVLNTEVKATPDVQKILAAPTTGTGSGNPEDDINKTVPAGAYGRYQDHLLSSASLPKVLETLRQADVGALLLLNWQAAFYQWVKDGSETKAEAAKNEKENTTRIKRPKKDMRLLVPAYAKKVPSTDRELKTFSKVLKRKLATYKTIQSTIASGKADDLLDAVGTNKKDLEDTETLFRHLVQRLQITYVLLSHISGDEESFEKDSQVTLHVALVNVQTGKFRYYARSIGRKSEVPATYPNLVGIMAKNLFEDAAKADRIVDL